MMKKDWIFILKFVTNIIINCWQFDRSEKESSRRIWKNWKFRRDLIHRGMMKKDWIFVLKFVINIIINCWQFDRDEKESSRRIWEMEIWRGDDDSIRRGMMKKDWIFVLKFNKIRDKYYYKFLTIRSKWKRIESKNLRNGNLGKGWWFDSSRDDEKRLDFRIKIRDKYNYKLLTIRSR